MRMFSEWEYMFESAVIWYYNIPIFQNIFHFCLARLSKVSAHHPLWTFIRCSEIIREVDTTPSRTHLQIVNNAFSRNSNRSNLKKNYVLSFFWPQSSPYTRDFLNYVVAMEVTILTVVNLWYGPIKSPLKVIQIIGLCRSFSF